MPIHTTDPDAGRGTGLLEFDRVDEGNLDSVFGMVDTHMAKVCYKRTKSMESLFHGVEAIIFFFNLLVGRKDKTWQRE